MSPILNVERRRQYLDLMSQSGWDVLMLYGHSWRKDFFRSLVNFNFFGPHALVALTRSNEISIVLSHPWDHEGLSNALDANVSWTADFTAAIHRIGSGKMAIAGREFMEARFVDESTVSATAAIEALRRIKTTEEIETLKQAARLADAGYRHFVDTAEVGMAEYELVAEVEAFLKTNGAEDNFMLIASGGPESLACALQPNAGFKKATTSRRSLLLKSMGTTPRFAGRSSSANRASSSVVHSRFFRRPRPRLKVSSNQA